MAFEKSGIAIKQAQLESPDESGQRGGTRGTDADYTMRVSALATSARLITVHGGILQPLGLATPAAPARPCFGLNLSDAEFDAFVRQPPELTLRELCGYLHDPVIFSSTLLLLLDDIAAPRLASR